MAENESNLVDRLAGLPKFAGIPRDELAWLVSHSEHRLREVGDVEAQRGVRVESMWIMLSGTMVIYVDRGIGPRQVMRWSAGDVTGKLPYSRMTDPPGDNEYEEPSEVLTIHERCFPEMVHRCPAFTALTVHLMLDRARRFNTSDLQDEKMVSLGKLAAGLAHELNNPASAAVRGAKLLRAGLTAAETASRRLGAAGLTSEALAELESVRAACARSAVGTVGSPLERADREEAFAEWLDRHGADPAHATTFAEGDTTLEQLDQLAATIPRETLGVALDWVAASATSEGLTDEIERSAIRIHDLVAAVKRFTRMDQRGEAETVDVEAGLRDTLRVLGSKSREKRVTVLLDIEAALPPACAVAGELNQIWLNLLDNALDAIAPGGKIEIVARRRANRVDVGIVDDGPGIPEDVRARIFDPFFTTKPPGQGTGLGLDIARRLARRWDGDVTVESRPGRTEFCVSLPAKT